MNYNETNTPETWNPHTADVAHLYAGISRFTYHIKIFTPGDHMVISQWYLEVVSLLEGHLKTPHDNRRISKDVVAKEIDSIGYDYYTKILKYSQTNPNPDGHVLGYCWVILGDICKSSFRVSCSEIRGERANYAYKQACLEKLPDTNLVRLSALNSYAHFMGNVLGKKAAAYDILLAALSVQVGNNLTIGDTESHVSPEGLKVSEMKATLKSLKN